MFGMEKHWGLSSLKLRGWDHLLKNCLISPSLWIKLYTALYAVRVCSVVLVTAKPRLVHWLDRQRCVSSQLRTYLHFFNVHRWLVLHHCITLHRFALLGFWWFNALLLSWCEGNIKFGFQSLTAGGLWSRTLWPSILHGEVTEVISTLLCWWQWLVPHVGTKSYLCLDGRPWYHWLLLWPQHDTSTVSKCDLSQANRFIGIVSIGSIIGTIYIYI